MLVLITDIMLYGRSLRTCLTDVDYEIFTKLLGIDKE